MSTAKSNDIRSFIVAFFADGDGYTTSDMADFAMESEDPNVRAYTTQQIGDALRAWADRNMLVRGYKCERKRMAGKRDRYFLKQAVSAKPAKSEAKLQVVGPKTEQSIAEMHFLGVVKKTRQSGEMLVESEGNLYTVKPLNW